MIASLLLTLSVVRSQSVCELTQSPVVGILVQDFLGDFKTYHRNRTFIPATYVKFVESAGARVVPLFTDQKPEYYERLLEQLNGVLLPGGDQDTVNSSFTRTANLVYQHAIRSSSKGVYFPVWAVCQGLEVLAYLVAGHNPLLSCSASDYATPLRFAMGFEELKNRSKMFQRLSADDFRRSRHQDLVFQWHHLCLLTHSYRESEALQQAFHVLATNVDKSGAEYVSIIEHKEHPVYGVMFHPEEVMFSFQVKENHTSVPHSAHALHMAQFFANFFADECRRSLTRMAGETLRRSIIYNFAPEHTTDSREPYDLTYFFEMKDYSFLLAS